MKNCMKKARVDVKYVNMYALKEDYQKEFQFITDLIDRARLPNADAEDSDLEVKSCEESSDSRDQLTHGNRAKSLAELHKRLAAVKEQKTTYRSSKIKTKLQSKLKRKKKMYENKIDKKGHLGKGEVVPRETNKTNLEDVKPPKPVFNSDGNLVFSKFDFLDETVNSNDGKLTKETSDKKRILEKLMKSQNYIKKLEEFGDSEKANQMRHESKWLNALRRSEGVKVKDDPQLLKKSLAKKQAKKKASEKKWKERLNTIENKKIEKQKKRRENIDNKLQEKKKKKRIKKAVKKGRHIPCA